LFGGAFPDVRVHGLGDCKRHGQTPPPHPAVADENGAPPPRRQTVKLKTWIPDTAFFPPPDPPQQQQGQRPPPIPPPSLLLHGDDLLNYIMLTRAIVSMDLGTRETGVRCSVFEFAGDGGIIGDSIYHSISTRKNNPYTSTGDLVSNSIFFYS
jgi:hypothetical protein